MRVLVTSTPGIGHINPMLPLALALRDAGHDVIWATGADGARHVRRAGITTRDCGLSLADRTAAAADRMPAMLALPPADRQPAMFATLFAELAGPPMHRGLTELVAALRPDLVVHDPNELAAVPVAIAAGLPNVTVGFGRFHPAPLLATVAHHVRPLWAGLDRAVPEDLGLYDHLYLHPLPASLQPVPVDRPVIAVRPTGHDGSHTPAPPWLDELGTGRPLVYVTFGTEFASVAPLGAVVAALGGLDVDVLVTVGSGGDPDGLPRLPPNVRVERFVPQRRVLDRASMMLSHGGSGAMIGALIAGRSHVATPLAADQFGNAEIIAANGLGVMLAPHEQTADAIANAVDRVLTDPTFVLRCRDLAAEIEMMPPPEEAVAHLESLIA